MRYENIVTGGKRVQKCFYWEAANPVPLDDTLIGFIRTADTICLAPLAPTIGSEYIQEMSRYRKKGSKTVLLPQGYFRQFDSKGNVGVREFIEAPDILPYVNVVIVSDEDHDDMLHIGQAWSSDSERIIVVTEAKDGAAVIQKGSITQVATIPVPVSKVVSSVGAGDAFAAGFMYQLFLEQDAVIAATFGNRVARQCLLCKPDDIRISVY